MVVGGAERGLVLADLDPAVPPGHVIRMLRASNMVPRVGQKLTIWIEDG